MFIYGIYCIIYIYIYTFFYSGFFWKIDEILVAFISRLFPESYWGILKDSYRFVDWISGGITCRLRCRNRRGWCPEGNLLDWSRPTSYGQFWRRWCLARPWRWPVLMTCILLVQGRMDVRPNQRNAAPTALELPTTNSPISMMKLDWLIHR